MVAFGNGPYGNGYRPGGPYWAYSSGQTLYLNDNNNPYFTSGSLSNYSAGWVDRSVTGVSAAAHDIGLGVSLFQLLTPGTNGQYRWPGQLYGMGCTGDHKTPCPADATGYFGYDTNTMPEGTSTVGLAVYDAVANAANTTWPVKVDRSPPTIIPSGSLWDHRNQASDHRNEGLYDSAYNLHVEGSDSFSGVKSVEVLVDGQSQANRGGSINGACTASGCERSTNLDWTLNADDYNDGEHTVSVVTKDHLADQAGIDPTRHTAITSIPITINRHGDVYSAALYDGDPSAGGSLLTNEVAQLNTHNARQFDDDEISTRHTIPCSQPSQQCGETRHIIHSDDTDASYDQPGDTFRVTKGTSEADGRLPIVATILEPANQDLGSSSETGPINTALSPWQTPPPGHGTTYALYETTEPDAVDGTATQMTRKLWIDQTTKLPLRTTTVVSGQVESDTYYTYERLRKTVQSLPADEFSVARPSNPTHEATTDYATNPSPDRADDPPPLTDDARVADARAFRGLFGLNTDETFIRSTLQDPALTPSIDRYGVPLTQAEQLDMAVRSAVESAITTIDSYATALASGSYAGLYVDQQHGGLVYVGFTKDAQQHLNALKALFPFPEKLRTFAVAPALTLSQLDALQTQVAGDVDALNTDGFDVAAVTEDEQSNRILVGVPNPTPDLQAKLVMRYANPAVVLVKQYPHPPASRTRGNFPPLYGGLGYVSETSMCTSGFSVRRGSRYYILTAGHCGTKGDQAHYDGNFLGRFERVSYPDVNKHASADAALIHIPKKYATSRVIAKSGRHLKVTRAAKFNDGAYYQGPQHPGMKVCALGYPRADPVCGVLS